MALTVNSGDVVKCIDGNGRYYYGICDEAKGGKFRVARWDTSRNGFRQPKWLTAADVVRVVVDRAIRAQADARGQ